MTSSHNDQARSAPTIVKNSDCIAGRGLPLEVRWLGSVPYQDAWTVQRGLHRDPLQQQRDYLMLLEHPHTFTLGRNANESNLLVDPGAVNAQVIHVDRGGDITYHGPGQLVAYPILTLPTQTAGGLPKTPAYVATLEEAIITALDTVGLSTAGRHDGYPGVWVNPNTVEAKKIAAIGVRIERGRSLHGVAINVAPDLEYFSKIIPCGITEYGVTSLAEQGVAVSMQDMADAFAEAFAELWQPSSVARHDVIWRTTDHDLAPFSRGEGPGVLTTNNQRRERNEEPIVVGKQRTAHNHNDAFEGTSVRLRGRLAEAGVVEGITISERKPDWMRAPVNLSDRVLSLKSTMRSQGLVTVCEEAGCPNLSECWSSGTATFMVCGERCTRACGFCLVDTRKPEQLDRTEPRKVAETVQAMGIDFAVITMVARDDLADGGAQHVAETVREIHSHCPTTQVEVLISDLRGDLNSLELVLASQPEVVNHNVETVPRLQRAVRPSAAYARSLSVLSHSVERGFITKSGLVLGMGETREEIFATLRDLAAIGVHIVTIGQYLRPTSHHLPVTHWWTPEEYNDFADYGHSLGIAHVESSPFTRSSHHAKESAAAAHQAITALQSAQHQSA